VLPFRDSNIRCVVPPIYALLYSMVLGGSSCCVVCLDYEMIADRDQLIKSRSVGILTRLRTRKPKNRGYVQDHELASSLVFQYIYEFCDY
jgi:hypothetical protein